MRLPIRVATGFRRSIIVLLAAGAGSTSIASASGFVGALPEVRAQPITESMRTTDDDYPSESRRAEQQGVVRLLITISAAGRVTTCSVYRSSRFPALDKRSCVLAIERFRFLPARRDGIAVEDTAILPVDWRIAD